MIILYHKKMEHGNRQKEKPKNCFLVLLFYESKTLQKKKALRHVCQRAEFEVEESFFFLGQIGLWKQSMWSMPVFVWPRFFIRQRTDALSLSCSRIASSCLSICSMLARTVSISCISSRVFRYSGYSFFFSANN